MLSSFRPQPHRKQIAEAREIVMKRTRTPPSRTEPRRKCNQKQLNKHLAVISKIGRVLVDNENRYR